MSKQPKAGETLVGDRLRAARARRGLSQSEAAREWGISKRTLQGWERGKEPRGLYREAIERILAGQGE